MIDRRDFMSFHPFARLNALLDGMAPGPGPTGDGAPILLSVGEPKHRPPDFITDILTEAAADWSRYPLPRGSPAYRDAAAAWLVRRYGLPDGAAAPGGMIDPEHTILPLPGTREGLFFAALAVVPASGGAPAPAVLVPNPFYQVYMGAALASGGEPVLVPATSDSGHLPDFAGLDPAVLDRAALCYFCSPSNPQGAVADLGRLEELITLARRHDFVAVFDECYSEIYAAEPPPGALQAAVNLGGSLDNMLVFHSLSKRSSAPGLRCGFVAGEARLIAALDGILRVGGAGVPLPVLAAGERLWRDEDHVVSNRARYQEKFAVAGRVLGDRFGYRVPGGGFFLWLDVGDGEAATVELWRRGGLKVLPGAYTAAATSGGSNPGAPYIRVALVHETAAVEDALQRLAEIL